MSIQMPEKATPEMLEAMARVVLQTCDEPWTSADGFVETVLMETQARCYEEAVRVAKESQRWGRPTTRSGTIMATDLKFKDTYDVFKRGPQTIDGVIDYHIIDAERMTERGELEELRAAVTELKRVVGRMATYLSPTDMADLAKYLGWNADNGDGF